ncbi:hypothetical protein AU467_14735 [Mesorhizobium loti]|uniref:Uncharacterized protein n=1 Tax=Rhizobium loti TaxID=381 RepID=A0A101KVW4_RHILI|nr:hypothetical protein AU467_14735 [Mesorhizobium loti]
MQLQRIRQCRCVDEALGEEDQREAGIDGCRFGRDGPGKDIWIGLIRGERREATCVTRARTGQLASSRSSSDAVFVRVFLCVSGTRASTPSLPSILVLAMGPVAALHDAFAMIESTMEAALAALF